MRWSKKLIWSLVTVFILFAGVIIVSYVRNYMRKSSQYTLYIGGYGNAAIKCLFNSKNMTYGVLSDFKAKNPSYLALSPSGSRIYGVSESGSSSGVWGFANTAGDLSLGVRKDGGADACYLTCFNGHLFTANYGIGGISVYPLDTSGNIKAPTQVVRFVTEGKKSLSRVHMVKIVAGRKTGNSYLLAADKGLDRMHVLKIDADTVSDNTSDNLLNQTPLRLYRNDSSFVQVPKGYGPRHIEVSKDGKFLYMICETSCRVLAYSMREDDDNLVFSLLQDTLADRSVMEASADIHLSPDGRYLYVSNRKGRDGIVIFQVKEDGTLSRKAFQATDKWPRSFAISQDGDFLFVCCQKDKCVQVFSIDKTTGYLKNTGAKISFPDLEPSCIIVRGS